MSDNKDIIVDTITINDNNNITENILYRLLPLMIIIISLKINKFLIFIKLKKIAFQLHL